MNDKLYEIIEYYRQHPVEFVEDILNIEPTHQQVELLNSFLTNKFIAIKSGHGTGKSTGSAMAILWFMCTRFNPQVPCTAPSSAQLNDVLWSRLADLYSGMDPYFKSQFHLGADRLYHKKHKKTWFCVGRTAKKENPEGLQGFHASNLMFIIDEASGVPDEVFTVILAALTEEENYCLMIGNPTRRSGYFYDAFTKFHDQWKCLTFNSEESPRVDQKTIDRYAVYGKDSDVYRVRILGEFPKQESDSLISYELLNAAETNNIITPSGTPVWGVDIARYGADSSVICKRIGNKITEIITTRQRDTMEVSGWVIHEYLNTPIDQRPESIFLDVIGIGSGTYDRMNELGYPVIPVNVSEKAFDKDNYRNVRAELYGEFGKWLQGNVDIPTGMGITEQAATMKYKFDSNGRIQLESKDEYKKRNPNIGSPDIADAVALTFYEHKEIPLQILWL